MSEILIGTVPLHGHFTPLLNVARYLVRRGDRVRFLTGPRLGWPTRWPARPGCPVLPTSSTRCPGNAADHVGYPADTIGRDHLRAYLTCTPGKRRLVEQSTYRRPGAFGRCLLRDHQPGARGRYRTSDLRLIHHRMHWYEQDGHAVGEGAHRRRVAAVRDDHRRLGHQGRMVDEWLQFCVGTRALSGGVDRLTGTRDHVDGHLRHGVEKPLKCLVLSGKRDGVQG